MFPHRTFAMFVGALIMVIVSHITNKLFIDQIVSREYDVLQCYKQKTIDMRDSKLEECLERKTNDEMVSLKEAHTYENSQ